ncbi:MULTISPECIES: anthranilate synthase component I family protein [Prochlorococcus]|uniref:anthranilate synthase component I family protein n=1 Tax=Prochlorococcus TaxID=1218 RepID=UPI000533710C|nr:MULTISPECIES: anthranilate synthase component I family protein [Prochlorococcus]KGG13600.1 Anthranilate synthase [Prochlorococcus sp. MIT 0601]
MHSSDRDSFLQAASRGLTFIPLVESWPADLETPLTTWLKVGQGKPPGVLLESVEGGETLGRWSVIASDPLWVAKANGDKLIRSWRNGESDEFVGNPFETLRDCLRPYRSEPIPDLPFLGQLYGMWGYELIQWIEATVPTFARGKNDPPDGVWMFMDRIIIFDQVKRLIHAVSYGDLVLHDSPSEAYEIALKGTKYLESLLEAPLPSIKPLRWSSTTDIPASIQSNTTKTEFESAVNSAKQFIKRGDIFQIVLSQKLTTQVTNESFEIYRSLRMVNPSPFMAFFDFGDWQLIGSSPEVMVQATPYKDSISASLRPIAGTRPRGKDNEEDEQLAIELLSDPKERAEHVMLVDLGRNDLGRVCIPGSVSVKELMVIEKYSHVMHIVSEVQGKLEEGKDVWDLLMAAFPAGTVSGAPKIRAMQLINELERDSRGPYSGVYGSMDLNGALNTAITIRTMVVSRNAQGELSVQVQAGAGVVADSIPSNEFQETINKAKGMLHALGCLQQDN